MGLVLDHLWQSTLFLVVAAVLTWALRRHQARARYVVWLIASVKFLLPYALLVAGLRWLPWPTSLTPAPTSSSAFFDTADAISEPFGQVSTGGVSGPHVLETPHSSALMLLVVALWAVGTVTLLVRWIVQSRKFRRPMVPLVSYSPRERDVLARIATQTAALNVETVLIDSDVEPGVAGVFRLVLFWPRGIADRLTDEQIDAVMAHELVHVRWHDNAAGWAHKIVEALFWFHPLVWCLGARLIDERERGCDEAVLRAGQGRQAYAEGILRICEFYVAVPPACASGVTGSDLKKRVEVMMRGDVGQALRGARLWLITAAIVIAVALPVAAGAGRVEPSQAPAQPTSPSVPFTFDVVSIKTSRSDDNFTMQAQPGGRLVATSVTLRLLLRNAFRLRDAQIVGGPDWIGTAHFDIEARAAGNPSQAQLQQMLQGLLRDHFKLVTHQEQREQPVYALVFARDDQRFGPKMRRATEDCADAAGNNPSAPPPSAVASALSICGFRVGSGVISGRGVTVRALAASLSNVAGRIVVDHSGEARALDVDLSWAPDTSTSPDASLPSLFAALQEQLGLKLEARREPVDVLVIDDASKPMTDSPGVKAPTPAIAPVSQVRPAHRRSRHQSL